MLCYQGRTFCTFHNECDDGEGCSRALTDQVRDEAKVWWGQEDGDPPFAIYSQHPDCFIVGYVDGS